ncbi:MAG: haloacid dehalogenase-like hydrolase [Planctomycetota bacterium]|nr:haloacid dehalogenase-like hydrolase [Planctomycetota bacterium]
MLILFDVDGTLLLSRGAGMQAMIDAGRELFGDEFTFDTVEFAGRLDPLIWSAAAERNRVADTSENHARFRAAYGRHLRARFATNPTAQLLPGVAELVERVCAIDGLTPGLLTGNYPETGRLKLETAGLDPSRFVVCAWGDDGPQRRDLPAIAMRRFEEATGRRPDPPEVIVIGDTPHDIDCAHVNGCRAIAVATGPVYSLEELRAHEPELALGNLSDTEGIVQWMLNLSDPAVRQR